MSANKMSNDLFPKELGFIPIGHPATMMSKESVRRAVEEFRVRPTDIIVSTFAKTGTTLVIWICHLLRTGGNDDLDFEFLYDVVPWPLASWDMGYDPNINGSQFFPRVFKSHLRMASVYRGCKYIVTIRDPGKTAISYYNFLIAKGFPLESLKEDVSQFVVDTSFIKGRDGRASLFEYYQEYHILRDCPSVLVLVYEDLVKDMPTSIRMIAAFMGISDTSKSNNTDDSSTNIGSSIRSASEVPQELVHKVASMSTKEYMVKIITKFDEPYERAKELGRAGDIQQLAPGAKVVLGSHPQKINETATEFLDQEWDKTMRPLGYENYKAFADTIREKNMNRFFKSL
mmetsp:Transcript_38883/g.45301  ORF Transcript_38883/g.45301 Transcript_38883/m.45301 type:complete len:343 (+) Transcript_38883:144-1172(+)